mgnify:CR=1 FL=1|tara:strand:- start:555 stop:3620 length:3066 start_codon:yes stop_codon:yes gene_type:complete
MATLIIDEVIRYTDRVEVFVKVHETSGTGILANTTNINELIPGDLDQSAQFPSTDDILGYVSYNVSVSTIPSFFAPAGFTPPSLTTNTTNWAVIDPGSPAIPPNQATTVGYSPSGAPIQEIPYPMVSVDSPVGPTVSESGYLEVVVTPDINFGQLQEDYGFTIPPNLVPSLKANLLNLSPVAIQVVVNGLPVINKYVYTDNSSGQIYNGPVHFHPTSGYMAGAVHTSQPHASLTRQIIPDITIKDHTIKDGILGLDLGAALNMHPEDVLENLGNTTAGNAITYSHISEPLESKLPDGKSRFLFYADYPRLVRSVSRYPGFSDMMIYDSALIKSLKIFRSRGTDSTNLTPLGVSVVSDDTMENHIDDRQLVISSADRGAQNQSMGSNITMRSSKGKLVAANRSVDKNLDGSLETLVGSIQEISAANLQSYRIFSVVDHEISEFTNGKYRYILEMETIDPTILYLNSKLSSMCAVKDQLEDLVNYTETFPVFDYLNRSYTNSYMTNHSNTHNITINNAIIEILDLIEVITGTRDDMVLNYLLSVSNTLTGDPAGLAILLEVMNSFENKLVTILGDNLASDNAGNGGSSSNTWISNVSNPFSNMLFFEKHFDYLANKNAPANFGYNYLGPTYGLFPMIAGNTYISRQTQESRKVYTPAGAQSTVIEGALISQAKQNALNATSVDYSYMTPASILAGSIEMPLIGVNSQIYNIEMYREIKVRLIQANNALVQSYSQNTSLSEMSAEMLANIGVSLYQTSYTSDVNQTYTDDTTSIFGSNNFNENNIEQTFDTVNVGISNPFIAEATNIVASAVGNLIAESGVFNPDSVYNQDQEVQNADSLGTATSGLSIENFDITKQNNLLNNMSTTQIAQLPLGVKSLVQGRQSFTLKNWLDHDKDLFRDPDLRDIYRFNQGMTVRVEYLSGHGQTSLGPSVKLPQYNPLSSATLQQIPLAKPMIARLRVINIPEIAIGFDDNLDADIYTQNFLISNLPGAPSLAATNIVSRSQNLTNYVMAQINLATSFGAY